MAKPSILADEVPAELSPSINHAFPLVYLPSSYVRLAITLATSSTRASLRH
jgi:hypothetical protein